MTASPVSGLIETFGVQTFRESAHKTNKVVGRFTERMGRIRSDRATRASVALALGVAVAWSLSVTAVAQVGAPIQIGPPPTAPQTDAPQTVAPQTEAPQTGAPAVTAPDDAPPGLLFPGLQLPGRQPPAGLSPGPRLGVPAESGSAAGDDAPPSGSAIGGDRAPTAGRTTSDGAIQIEQLRRVTVDATGTLTPAIGGLRTDLWAGTPGPLAVRLVGLLPTSTDSRAIRDLSRRLLLTSGAAPADLRREGDLLEARVRRLFAIGALDDLRALAARIPATAMNSRLARTLTNLGLAVGDDATACNLFDRVTGTSDDQFWIQVGMVCDKRAGRDAKVDFGARLLTEIGFEDPLFASLAQAATGGQSGAAFRLAGAEPVHLALARVAELRIDPDIAAIESLPVLIALSRGSGSPPFPAQLAAAEKAERAGAILPQAVTDLYNEVAVKVPSVDGAVAIAEADPGPLGRAILWRAAEEQTVPIARAQAIARAMDLARGAADWRQTARLFAPLLVTLAPGPELDWMAEDVIRALVAADETRAARTWIDRMRRLSASRVEEASESWRRLWPLLHLAGGSDLVGFDEGAVARWWGYLRDTDPDEASQRAAVALSLMAAVGTPVGDDVWRGLAARPSVQAYEGPATAVRLALRAAGEAGRLGEVASLSATALGQAGLVSLEPVALAEVANALVAVGLDAEARRLGVEAALAHGL